VAQHLLNVTISVQIKYTELHQNHDLTQAIETIAFVCWRIENGCSLNQNYLDIQIFCTKVRPNSSIAHFLSVDRRGQNNSNCRSVEQEDEQQRPLDTS